MKVSEREIILRVQNVSKIYHLKQKLQGSVKDIFNTRTNTGTASYTALSNISFELRKGESMGIFGSNGAGKSTLLRILSGITKPSTGDIDIYGRCLSILDIGTGFHPDLTGRENIFTSGEILGLSRTDIETKLNEIVEFSELNDYIDEPVKNYSSGMYLRLAFSVIAFLEADLMLFDETMSVGDLSFRKKCREKIESLIKEGKSMIIVSHNMNEIISLCNKFMHIDGGEIKAISGNYEILSTYMDRSLNSEKQQPDQLSEIKYADNKLLVNNFSDYNIPDIVEVTEVKLEPTGGLSIKEPLFRDQELNLTVDFIKKEVGSTIDVSFGIIDAMGGIVLSSSPISSNKYFDFTETGKCRAHCIIPKNLFNRGQFFINIYFMKDKNSIEISLLKLLSFQINFREGEYAGVHPKLLHVPGALAPLFDWSLSYEKYDEPK